MNSAFDFVGVGAIVAAVAVLALALRKVSGGRMKRILKALLVSVILVVAGMLLWNISVSFW